MTKQFTVGDKVTWISSNVRKRGEVVARVPAGSTPADVDHPKAGGGGMSRDHESYVIRAKKCQYRTTETYGSNAYYWPFVSLLEPA